jgi:hypothetical protein
MIRLPDGDEVPDREKHMIQSPNLMRTFVWNPHGFQVVNAMPCHAMPCHAMPKGEMFRVADYIRNILTETVLLLDVERDVKGSWSCMRTMQDHSQQR